MLEKSKLDRLAEVVDELTINRTGFLPVMICPKSARTLKKYHIFLHSRRFKCAARDARSTAKWAAPESGAVFTKNGAKIAIFSIPVQRPALHTLKWKRSSIFPIVVYGSVTKICIGAGNCTGGLGRHISTIPDFSFANMRIAFLEGFNYDPFEKKANLLRMILACRPERFVDNHQYGPVVDYHVMRLLIRTGVIPFQEAMQSKNMAHGRTHAKRIRFLRDCQS